MSPVPSLSVVAAVLTAESFPFEPLALAPSAVSVDLAAGSVAGSLSVPSVDDAGYADAARSTVHGHLLRLLLLGPPMIMRLLRLPHM